MFAKTVCKPGSHICVVPVGLLTTLQYNAKGVLEKVFEGYGDDRVDITAQVFNSVSHMASVPTRIKISGGTTWVEGAIHSPKSFQKSGLLPMCITEDIIKDIGKSSDGYKFYAGNVSSLAAPFNSLLSIHNWLQMSQFDLLPTHLMFAGMSDEGFDKVLKEDTAPFTYPLFSGFMIFENADIRYHRLNLKQHIVNSASDYMSPDGYLMTQLICQDGSTRVIHRSDKVKFNLDAGVIFVTAPDNKIIYSNCKKQIDNRVKCPTCGNLFECPDNGPVRCTDSTCPSHLHSWIARFSNVLDLPSISEDELFSKIESHDVTCFLDVLLLPQYKDMHVETSLFKFLKAITPAEVCVNESVFSKLAAVCGNSTDTLLYYMNNLSRLSIELDDCIKYADRLLVWLSDPYIASTIEALLNSDQITIRDDGSLFEGAPIFRGKKIAVTGTFRRGSVDTMVNILKSYDASVSIGIQGTADCLVIGQLNEGNDGRSIHLANSQNIIIYNEDTFFEYFDIDNDIAAHLNVN